MKGRTYIRLSAEEAAVDETLDLSATGFASGGRYELLVDGEAIKGGDVTADAPDRSQ